MITYPTNKLQKVLLGGGCEQRNLPSGYTQVEYLESSGTQYIDIGIVPKTTLSVKIKYNILQLTAQNNIAIFGSILNRTGLFSGLSGIQVIYYINSSPETAALPDIPVSLNTILEEEYINNTMIRSGVTYATNPIVENNVPMVLFGRNTGTKVARIGALRIYYFTLYDNGVLIQNYIPCKRNSDNVLGMYDTVTGTFFTNQGTGDFIAGPVVIPTPDEPMDIVCNNGVLKYGVSIIDWNNVVDNYTINANTGQALYTTNTRCYIDYFPINIGDIIRIYSTDINELGSYLIQYASNTESSFVESVKFTAINGYKYAVATTNGYARIVYLKNKDVAVQNNWAITKNQQLGIYTDGTQEVVTDNLGNTANAEMLLAVGDYKDSQEVISGVVKRKVGIKVLDGSEDWVLSTTVGTSSLFYCTQTNMDYTSTSAAICTHYTGELPSVAGSNQRDKSIKASYDNSEITHIRLYLRDTSFATLSDLTTFLANQYNAGTPVIIIYPLETATTETVTAQPLAGSSATVTAGSIDNLPIVTDNITKLKSRFITDANGEIQEVKRVYIGDNLVYSAEIEEQS